MYVNRKNEINNIVWKFDADELSATAGHGTQGTSNGLVKWQRTGPQRPLTARATE